MGTISLALVLVDSLLRRLVIPLALLSGESLTLVQSQYPTTNILLYFTLPTFSGLSLHFSIWCFYLLLSSLC